MKPEQALKLRAGDKLIRRKRNVKPGEDFFEIVYVSSSQVIADSSGKSVFCRLAKRTSNPGDDEMWLYTRNLMRFDSLLYAKLMKLNDGMLEAMRSVSALFDDTQEKAGSAMGGRLITFSEDKSYDIIPKPRSRTVTAGNGLVAKNEDDIPY